MQKFQYCYDVKNVEEASSENRQLKKISLLISVNITPLKIFSLTIHQGCFKCRNTPR